MDIEVPPYFLTVMNITSVNILVYDFCRFKYLSILSRYLVVRLLGPTVDVYLTLLE